VYGLCLLFLRNPELNQIWHLLRAYLPAKK
jgi:hypothetical protein